MNPSSITVLVLDSDEAHQNQIQDLLSSVSNLGGTYFVQCVSNLEEGRKALREWKGDVIICNMNLSDSQGLTTFQQLGALVQNTPIVVLSDHEDDEEALEAVRTGAHDYLVYSALNPSMLSRVLRYAIERNKARQEMHMAQERYRLIFDNSNVAITLVDHNERIISWNRYTEELLQVTKDDLYFKHVSNLYPPDEWQKLRELNLRQTGAPFNFETKMIRADKKLIDVELSLSVIKDDSGVVTGAVGIAKDITERLRLENVKNEFISTVSHEMRTPMTIIREGISQVLDEILGPATDAQKEILGLSLESIDRLARVINDMLDISSLESGKMKFSVDPVNINNLVNKTCESLSMLGKDNGVELKVELPTTAVTLDGDQDKLIQILTNLVGNAFKFTEQGHILVRVTDEKDEVLFEVQDTGKGMSEEDLPQAFNAFQQFGREDGPGEKGTGLGLAIVKKLVELHRGEIWAESQLDQGTTFSFRLPKQHP